MKNKILILLGILSFLIIPKNVYGANFEEATYDYTISVFDKYGYDLNLLANCDKTYSYDPSNNTIVQSNPSGTNKLCDTSHGLTLTNIKKYFKYYIHVNYRDLEGNEEDTYLVFLDKPYILKERLNNGETRGILVGDNGRSNSLDGIVIQTYTAYDKLKVFCSCCSPSPTATDIDFRKDIKGNANIGQTYLSGFVDWYNIDNNNTFSFMEHQQFDIYSLLNYSSEEACNQGLNIHITTNFELVDYEDTATTYISGLNGFDFDSDITLKIKYDNYALLIPKKNSAYSSFFWVDNVYQFSSRYVNSGIYGNDIDYYSHNTVLRSLVNEYANWGRWKLIITNEDLQNNISFRIANQNRDSELTLKFKSEDFYYYIKENSSSSTYINGIEYPNDYGWIHEQIIKDNVSIEYNYGIDKTFFSNIPNIISGFKQSFVFIGTLFTTFFNLIGTDITNYFIILFAFLLIFILFNLLK